MKRTKGWRLIDSVVQINNVNKGGKGRRGRNELGEVNVLEERRLLAATVLSTQGTSATTGGNGNSTFLGMSEDGRYALYQTSATDVNTSVTDTNGQSDLYLVDRVTGTETLVSRSSSSATTSANGGVTTAFISADGNTIAYESTSTNVVADQVNQLLTTSNVFLYNRVTGTTTLVSGSYGSGSVSGNGSATLNDLKNPLSVDGKFLIYQTRATDVNSGITDLNISRDVYRYNRITGVSELVSRSYGNATQTELLQGTVTAAASDDGQRVIFNRETLIGSPLVAWNGSDNSVRIVDYNATNTTNWISGDGKWIAYAVYNTSQNGVYLTSFTGDYLQRVSWVHDVKSVMTSYDGRYVSFLSPGNVPVAGATFTNDYTYEAFVFDRLADADGEAYLVSHNYSNDLAGVGGAQESYITPNGRYVFWASYKTSIVNGTFLGNTNVYRFDFLTKKNVLISSQAGTSTTGADGQSLIATLARGLRSDLTGDLIGYNSSASNLTSPNDANTNYYDAVVSSNGIGDKVGTWSNGRFFTDVNDNRTRDLWRDVSGAFGATTDVPIAGNWNNSDGMSYDEIGTFKNGVWSLDNNGNSVWDGASGGDLVATFGQAGDLPIIGDWNGDGKDEIGVFRNGTWYLDTNGNFQWDGTSGGDTQLGFGIAGDLPLAGDWNGDGIDDIGIVRSGTWYLDLNGNRSWDSGIDGVYTFGNSSGDTPVVGDWDRDGKDDIGVFRSGVWYFDMNGNRSWNSGSDATFTFGNGSDVALVGKWKNAKIGQVVPASNLTDDVGKWNNAIFARDADYNRVLGSAGDTSNEFGISTDTGIVGDWDGDGFDEIGVYRNGASSSWYLDYNGSLAYNAPPNGDLVKSFGISGDTPVVGNWNGGGKDEIGVFRISNGSGVWYLDSSGNFQWDSTSGGDIQAVFGVTGDVPVVGDWNGDGKDKIGVFRISGGQTVWYLDANGNRNWDGVSGGDIYAVFGSAGDTPIVGDWNGDGKDDIGVFNAGSWSLDLNGNFAWNSLSGGDTQFTYGSSGDKPLVGNWKPSGVMASMAPLSAGVSPSNSSLTVSSHLPPTDGWSDSNSGTHGKGSSVLASSIATKKKSKGVSGDRSNEAIDVVFAEVASVF